MFESQTIETPSITSWINLLLNTDWLVGAYIYKSDEVISNLWELNLELQADNISEKRRASAFGILSGITSCAFVCGNLATRFISISSTFQVQFSLLLLYLTLYIYVYNLHMYVYIFDVCSKWFDELGCCGRGGDCSTIHENFPAGVNCRCRNFCEGNREWSSFGKGFLRKSPIL